MEGVDHWFVFDSVEYIDLRKIMRSEEFRKVYRKSAREEKHCEEVEKERERKEARREKRPECDKIKNVEKRDECRKKKIEKCKRRREKKGKKAMEHPCTSSERRRSRRRRKDSKTWSKTRNCSSLPSKSDRKVCRREKRQRCKDRLAHKLPEYHRDRIADMCRRKQDLSRCRRKNRKDPGKCERDLRMELEVRYGSKNNMVGHSSNGADLKHMIADDVRHI